MPRKTPEERRARERAYAAAHPEIIQAKSARHRARNKQTILAGQASYVASNREKVRASSRLSREKHAEAINARRALHREQMRAALWPLTRQHIPKAPAFRLEDEASQACRHERRLQANAMAQKRREANPEKYREKDRTKRQANLEAIREADRANKRAMPPEKRAASYQVWSKANPEKVHEKGARRRARQAGVPLNDFSAAQWAEVRAAYNYQCAYCGKREKATERLTQDHISPIVFQGSHTLHNVVPACKSCNARKHTGPPLTPVQPLLLTIAPARKERA